MNAYYITEPKLTDVMSVVSNCKEISTWKREGMISSLNSVGKWTGKKLSDIPAAILPLGEIFDEIQPAALGISPKTLANVKSLSFDAIALSELVPGVMRHKTKGRPRAPEWDELYMALTKRSERNGLSRMFTYCNRENIRPEQVNTEVIERLMEHMRQTSFRKNQYQVHRTVARMWNELVDRFPHRNFTKVQVPVSRLRRCRVPLDTFPRSFLKDWADYAAWLQGEDMFADDAHPTRLRQTTIDGYERKIHMAASLLVETGVESSSIRSLADLTNPEAVKRILRRRHEMSNGQASYETFFTGQLLMRIERDWNKGSPETVAELKRLLKKLPVPTFQMTQKNNRLVSKFDDPKLLQQFLTAPDRIWEDSRRSRKTGRFRLAELQASLGIAILMNMPIRLGNLTALEFDKHLSLIPGGTSTLRLTEDETKTGTAVEFTIPAPLAERLIEYRDTIAPAIIGTRPRHLFTDATGRLKGFATVRYLVQRYVKLYVGIHINPHAYRHLAAKFILDEQPGAHVLVQHLLGHKKVDTTSNYYAGINTRRAGRHHQALLDRALSTGQDGRRNGRSRGWPEGGAIG